MDGETTIEEPLSDSVKCSCPSAKVPLPWHNSALP